MSASRRRLSPCAESASFSFSDTTSDRCGCEVRRDGKDAVALNKPPVLADVVHVDRDATDVAVDAESQSPKLDHRLLHCEDVGVAPTST